MQTLSPAQWVAELDAAGKRDKDYIDSSRKLVQLFEGKHKVEAQYNILYSNTETLSPAMYNTPPRPVVQRRFRDEDPVGAKASLVVQRTLEYLIDDGMSEYATFDELMQSAVLEGLVPGRGVTRFKYEAEMETVEPPIKTLPMSEQTPGDVGGEEPGQTGKLATPSGTYERVKSERVIGEEVPWDRFRHGYAKKWKDVPWVAFQHFMNRGEAEEHFGAELAAKLQYTAPDVEAGDSDETQARENPNQGSNIAVCELWEVWDKSTRMVYFVAPCYPDGYCKEPSEDPLGLTGFFPCPKPLTFTQKISTLIPVPLYRMYEEQAKELNRVTVRINKIIAALKVRGFYDSTMPDLSKVMEAEDNTLIPAENVAALVAQGMTLEKSIWLMPIETLVAVLQQLYLQRTQVKQVIFEITGIADIMRGSSQASETLGAQEIKNQWGTLRLKRSQKAVARYARDCLRIMAEIAVTHCSADTLRGMTELPYPTNADKEKLQMLMQQLAMSGQPIPPQIEEAAPALLEAPTWEDLLALLRDDLQRSFRIDIETNSTVDAEATEDKQNISELLNALAQFLNGVQPLVDAGTLPFEAAQGMMLAIVRRFRFGPELEDQLKKMKPPEPKPDPAAQKVQAQMELDKQKAALDAQAKQQELMFKERLAELDMRMKQMELQFREREMQMRERELQLDAAYKQQEHVFKQQQLQRQGEADVLNHNLNMETARFKAAEARKPKPAAKQPARA